MKTKLELVPLLVVQGASRAIDFYVAALGAKVLARYEHGRQRHVSHADLGIDDVTLAVTEEAREWNSDAPPSLGGSPVVLQLNVDDAEAVLGSMASAGATVVYPLQELFGERMARVCDPFGHLWLLRQRVDEFGGPRARRSPSSKRRASSPRIVTATLKGAIDFRQEGLDELGVLRFEWRVKLGFDEGQLEAAFAEGRKRGAL